MSTGPFQGGDLMAGPPPTPLPADPADAELAGGDAPAAVVRRHPASPAAWAALALQAQEAGADDVETDEEGHWIYCADTALNDVAVALEASLGESETAKLIWKPQAPTEVGDLDHAQKLMKLIDTLEDDDDVQTVTGNFDISEEIAAQL